MQPLDDQLELIAKARAKLKEIAAKLARDGIKRKPRLMVQAGCGFGKTYLAAFMAQMSIALGNTACMVVHRGFLMDQTSTTFKDVGINHSFIAAGKRLNPWAPAHIGMVGSMKGRKGKLRKPPALCFMDEGHHGIANTWRAIVDEWPDTIFIFLSATPGFRSDKKGLDEICDDIVCGPPNADLIERGRLSDYIWKPFKVDVKYHKRCGEHDANEQAEEMSRQVIIGNIISTYKREAMGKRAIYFWPTVAVSKMYAEAFTAAGIPAMHIDKDSTDWERKSAAMRMADGDIWVICNQGICTEGYDLAAQAGRPVTIEVVGLGRKTASFPLLVQMAMRAMRAKDTPGIILDHANNYEEHQWLPDDDVEWTLAGAVKREKTPTRLCAGCGAVVPKAVLICRHCGAPADAEVRRATAGRSEVEHVDGEMYEIDRQKEKQAQKWAKKQEIFEARTLEELTAIGKKNGYKFPQKWAAHIFSHRAVKERRA